MVVHHHPRRLKWELITVPTLLSVYLLATCIYSVDSSVGISAANEFFKCPELLSKIPNFCESIKCGNAVSQQACPPNTIYVPKKNSFCGCICPSCVQFIGLGDNEMDCVPPDTPEVVWIPDPNCDEVEGYCPVKVNTCLSPYQCNARTKKCDPPDSLPNRVNGECMYRKYLRRQAPPEVHWDPDCEDDGSFSPKQCKGSMYDGECFCVDSGGNRIFGREWRIKAENQTCACSRKTHELRSTQGLTATFHCSSDGNFEALQCDTDSGLCYCVDPKTGRLNGAVLPETEWKSLPCYSLNVTGNHKDGKYLRKCESEFAANRQLKIIGRQHGLDIDMQSILCDFDGSYPPTRIVYSQAQCVFKNGTKIGNYGKPNDQTSNCNCARDKDEYLPSSNKVFSGDCEENTGNFKISYDFGSMSSCVDKDGFLFGLPARSTHYCCLKADGCSAKIAEGCYDAILNENGYKSCNYYQYQS